MLDALEGFRSQDVMGTAARAPAAPTAAPTSSSTVGDLTSGDAESSGAQYLGGFNFSRGNTSQAPVKAGINPTVLIGAGVVALALAAFVLLKLKGKA